MPTVQMAKVQNKSFIPNACCEDAIIATEYCTCSTKYNQSFRSHAWESNHLNVLSETKSKIFILVPYLQCPKYTYIFDS